MRHRILIVAVALALVAGLSFAGEASPDWAMNATIIEACTCPMFCQCYFNPEPAAHGGHGGHDGEHYCKFNNAFHVNSGHHGATSLEGAEFWVSGDLGDNFADGKMKWAVVTFDPSVTPEQRAGITAVLGALYPVEWESFEVADDAEIEWMASQEKAVATHGGGDKGEVVLKGFPGMGGESVVLQNIVYWGAQDHDGLVMMPNEVQAYREGDQAFESKGTNGFMVTFDISSAGLAQTAAETR